MVPMTPRSMSRDPVNGLRVASWNLLRRVGAEAEDVAKLIHAYRPDLLLLQEATEEIAALCSSRPMLKESFVKDAIRERARTAAEAATAGKVAEIVSELLR